MISEIRYPIYDMNGKLVDGGHLRETPLDCYHCPQYVGAWSIKTCSGCPNESIGTPPGYYKDYGIRKSVELTEAKKEIEALKARIQELEANLALPVYERDPRSQCIVNRRGDPPESCASSGSLIASWGSMSG